MSDDTLYKAAKALRKAIEVVQPTGVLPQGWTEDAVEAITRHVLDELRARQEAEAHQR